LHGVFSKLRVAEQSAAGKPSAWKCCLPTCCTRQFDRHPSGLTIPKETVMWSIEANQIKGKVIRPAPMGTETHPVRCVVYEDAPDASIQFSVVRIKNKILTAKTMRGLKGAATRAGLVWSENLYIP
jgi:hypothetical protein